MRSSLHVAVGVVMNAASDVLISLRDADAHQGGLWEFPGGKVERSESVQQALYRELDEELGIQIDVASLKPLIEVRHDYGDRQVLLDVWVIDGFSGVPVGREGQPLEWVPLAELNSREFPAANVAIIEALQD